MNIERIVFKLNNEHGIETQIHTVTKNGVVKKQGLVLIREDNVCPTVYFDEYDNEDEFIDMCVDAFHNAKAPDNLLENILNLDFVKSNVHVCVGKKGCNDKHVSTKNILDLELYMRIFIESGYDGVCSCVVTTGLIEDLGIDEEELWTYARNNSFSTRSVKSILEFMGVQNVEEDDVPLYIVTVNMTNEGYGAAALAFDEIFEKFCMSHGDDACVIIPASIHELLVTPKSKMKNFSIEELTNLVKSINCTELKPEHVLSDSVYEYSLYTGLGMGC